MICINIYQGELIPGSARTLSQSSCQERAVLHAICSDMLSTVCVHYAAVAKQLVLFSFKNVPLASGLHCIPYKKIIPPPPPKCKFSLFSSSLKPGIVRYRKCELKGTDIPPAQRERGATFCPCCIINGTMFLCCRWLRASKAYSRP